MPKAPRFPFRLCARLLLPALATLIAFPRAHAQATPAASKAVDLSVFAGYEHALPDYGPFGNNGGAIGFDFTRYLHFRRFPVDPSFEFRANVHSGKQNREDTYLFGVRGQGTVLTKFHPYADFLIGPGNIHFVAPVAPGYTGDNSTVKSIGGGLDYDISNSFSAKIDYQYQFWQLGTNYSLTPSVTIIGVVYRIPFRPHNRQADLGY